MRYAKLTLQTGETVFVNAAQVAYVKDQRDYTHIVFSPGTGGGMIAVRETVNIVVAALAPGV